MNHKQKVKLARRISGKQTGHFESDEWGERKEKVANQVKKKEEKQKEAARLRKEKHAKL